MFSYIRGSRDGCPVQPLRNTVGVCSPIASVSEFLSTARTTPGQVSLCPTQCLWTYIHLVWDGRVSLSAPASWSLKDDTGLYDSTRRLAVCPCPCPHLALPDVFVCPATVCAVVSHASATVSIATRHLWKESNLDPKEPSSSLRAAAQRPRHSSEWRKSSPLVPQGLGDCNPCLQVGQFFWASLESPQAFSSSSCPSFPRAPATC